MTDDFLAALAVTLGCLTPEALAPLRAGGPEGTLLNRLVAAGALSARDADHVRQAAEQTVARYRKVALSLGRTHTSEGVASTLMTPVGLTDTLTSRPEADVAHDLQSLPLEAPGRYQRVTDATGAPVELGRGGIGLVLLALDSVTGRTVAMKQLLPQANEGHQSLAPRAGSREHRFLREARVTAQLEHPSIVPVYDIGLQGDGQLYYTMRRIEGRTLAEAIAAAPSLKERLLLLPRFLDVCQAIAYAHSHSVIHRDLKPQNIMLGRFGETWVLDWGLARLRGRITGEMLKVSPSITGAFDAGVIGTPAYMSPEQAQGELSAIDERSDVWGLGAVLYEILTAKTPYSGASALEVIAKIRTEPFTPLAELQPDVPADLKAICDKCLRREKHERYASAADLAADIDLWLQGRRVSAHRYSATERVARFFTRYRLPIRVALVAAAVLALGASWSWVQLRRERNEARQMVQLMMGEVIDVLPADTPAMPAVKALTERALNYYDAHGHAAEMTRDEQSDLAGAVTVLASLNLNTGRASEATRLLSLCDSLSARWPTDEAHADLVLRRIGCLLERGHVTINVEPEVTARVVAEASQLAKCCTTHWQQPDWALHLMTLAVLKARLAYDTNDMAAAEAALTEADGFQVHMHDVRFGPSAALQFLTLQQMRELISWGLGRQPAALTVGEETLEWARAQGVRSRSLKLQSNYASLARQHGMLLSWVPGRSEEAHQVLAEAQHLIGEVVLQAGDDAPARGELADCWLELGRPDEAVRVMAEMKAVDALPVPYEVTHVEALVLSGQTAEGLRRTEGAAGERDVSLLLMRWLALLHEGRTADAKALLPKVRAQFIEQTVVWPRASIQAFAAQCEPTLAQALKQFDEHLQPFFYDQNDDAGQQAVDEFAAALHLTTP